MISIDLYTTPTCMPCKILKKKLESLDSTNLKIISHNALEHPEMNIMATPHVIAKCDNEIIFEGHVNSIAEFVGLIKSRI